MTYKKVKLREVCSVNQGLQIPIAERYTEPAENRYFYITVQFLKNSSQKYYIEDPSESVICKEDDILVVRTGSTGRVVTGVEGCFHNNFFKVKPTTQVNNRFLYYSLNNNRMYRRMVSVASGTTIPDLKHSSFYELDIFLPPLTEQKAIADTLSALDDKIEVNNQINENLEQQAQVIFKHWFVDFEFPDENGNPYKSSGGEMVESEEGMIPKGWEVKELDEIMELHDAKRVPLSKKQRDSMKKIYPYYGATSIIDYVNDYIFDGTYLLLGEDGSVSDDMGYPILQYVWGKIWVNNHAHVITGKGLVTVEYLYMLLSNTNIRNIITGAVQKKINQRNLKGLKILSPTDEIKREYIKVIDPIFNFRKQLITQNQKLSQLRDTLLPKLMSGEIRLPLD